MKLQILCDLHVEFGNFIVPDAGAHLIILAGDVHVKDKGLKWVLDQGFEVPVIYVLGNHEFYRDKFPGLIDKLRRDAEGTNVHVLENEAVEIGGFLFFGCTLWTDMELFGHPNAAMCAAREMMNDYRLIRDSETYRRLTPSDTVAHHKQSVSKLTEFLEIEDPEKSIIVTHHTPSIQSINEIYRDHPVTPAFATNMEYIIKKHGPRLWIHGHTHENYDYRIGKTRIICNPRGYVPSEDNPEFEAGMIVEV